MGSIRGYPPCLKTSEERYLNSFARTCFVGEAIEDDEEDLDPSSDDMQVQPMDDSVDLEKLTPACFARNHGRAEAQRTVEKAPTAHAHCHQALAPSVWTPNASDPESPRAILKAGKAPA